MKKIVLTITLCVLALNAFAQKNGTYTKSINMELLGSSGMVGAWINEGSRKAQFGYTLFADIAYRYQKPTGFTFSVGLKPQLFNVLWPYITLGYSF